MPLSTSLLIIALVVALAQVERKGLLQAMLSRPLVMGTLLGALLGDVGSGLMLGALLELLWLGAINVGSNVPDNEVVGTGAVVGATLIAAGHQPAPLELATLATASLAPMAVAGRLLDGAIEKKNSALTSLAERRLEKAPGSAGLMNLLGLLAPPLLAAALAVAGASAGGLLLPRLMSLLPNGALAGLAFAFPMLVIAAAAVAVVSIRDSKASLWAAASAGAGLVVLVFYSLTWGPS